MTALRFDSSVQPTFQVQDITSVMGLSGRLERSLAGHARFAVGIAVLYGFVWALGLWSELGYSYDRFGTLAWLLSLPVATWVAGSFLCALWLDVTATRAGRTNGLACSLAALFIGLGCLVLGLMFVLPAERTIQASFQTRTAAAGYLKDAEFIFLPLLVFVVPTFHAILRLQREMRVGRHDQVLSLLGRGREAVVPPGMFFLSPQSLAFALLVYGAIKVFGTNYMLDALTPGPYAQLFTVTGYVSTAVALAIGIAALMWYSARLNDLKREAVAVIALKRRESNPKQH